MRSVSLLTLLSSALAFAQSAWEPVRTEADGLTLESRTVEGTRFREYRVRAHSDASPTSLLDAAWAWRSEGVEARYIGERRVLEEAATERVEWQLMRLPMVATRETVLRFERATRGETATIRYAAIPREAPRDSGAVRMRRLQGGWTFSPDPRGGTLVEHRVLSDPGGEVPEWLARSTQQDVAIAVVRELLHRF